MTDREKLSPAALAFRSTHAALAGAFLIAIGYGWWCALATRRWRLLPVSVGALIGEGVVVAANREECPLGGLQDRLGDPAALFELVLLPMAARRSVPVLGLITAAGIALLAREPDRGTPCARVPMR